MSTSLLQEFSCKVCGNTSDNRRFTAKELAYGMGDEFEYVECGSCGCLQITETPVDLSRYYPKNYYSFAQRGSRFNPGKVLRYLWRVVKQGNFATVLKRARRTFVTPEYVPWLKSGRVKLASRVLDVGCGSGERLFKMAHGGFTRLTGVDPFIAGDIVDRPPVRIFKKSIYEIEGTFDFIMLHHSFEHMEDPLRVLRRLRELLADDGSVLIRIPVAGSFAWKKYTIHWVQLDAPRHLFIQTPRSMEVLAGATGLRVTGVEFDSDASQFWGSEQNLRGIGLWASNSYSLNPAGSIFSEKEIDSFVRQTGELNARGEGDTAAFFLEPSGS